MYGRSIAIFLVIALALLMCGLANAGINGTADGTYDFSNGNTAANGGIGADDSAGAGFATFSDKFFLSNGMAIDDIVLTSIWTLTQQTAGTYGTFTIKAEGGSTCKTFTFKDMGIHLYDSGTGTGGQLSYISVTTKDRSGATIATHSGNVAYDVAGNSIIQLSALINGGAQFSDAYVASIEITWRFAGTTTWPAPSNLNFDNITIANVSAASVPSAVTGAATGVSATGATLNGIVNANGDSTAVTFEYGTTTGYGDTATAAQSPVTGVVNTNVSAALTGLSCGTLYHFRVKGVNNLGTAYGSDATFTTSSCNTAPTFVGSTTTLTVNENSGAADITSLLHVSDSDTGQTETWTESAAPNHGGVLGGLPVTASSGGADITPGGAITYQPASGYAGTETFTVQVSDGAASATRTITVSVVPSASTAASASSITAAGFNANWGSVSGATGYYLDVSADSGFTSLIAGYANKDVGNVTSHAVAGLSAGTTYYYRVRAYAGTLTGGDSNTITVLTSPGASTAAAATSVTTTGFNANWGSVSSADGYYLDVATDNAFTAFVGSYNNMDAGNATSYPVSGLAGNTQYYYRVRAYNSGGSGENSNTVSLTTAPEAPVAKTASANTPGGFTANWDASAGAAGYYLDVATDSGFTNYVTGFSGKDVGNSVNAEVGGLAPGAVYHYRLRAYNGYGASSNSNVIDVVTLAGAVTGVVTGSGSPATLYSAVDGGGIWNSADGGATWSAATTQPANNRIKGLVIHPATRSTLYAATYGGGVFTSVDSGATWTACAGQPANLNAVSLAIDPSGILYAGTEGGIFTSADCASWSEVNTGLTVDAATPPVAIAIDPATPATLYAGLDGAGVWKSANSGGSWTAATTQPANLRIKALVIKPGDATKLYAATYGGGVFASADSGGAWSACATQPTNLNTVSLIIDADGKLFAGTGAGVFVSADGCATWTAMSNGLP